MDGRKSVLLKAEDIFASREGYALTDFGSHLQGLILDKIASNDGGMGLEKRIELKEGIEERYMQLEIIQGREIPRDESAFNSLENQFNALVRERRELSLGQL